MPNSFLLKNVDDRYLIQFQKNTEKSFCKTLDIEIFNGKFKEP